MWLAQNQRTRAARPRPHHLAQGLLAFANDLIQIGRRRVLAAAAPPCITAATAAGTISPRAFTGSFIPCHSVYLLFAA